MAQKNRVYGTVEEYQNRLAIYASRYVKWELERVPENKYADWTQEELSGLFGYNADMKRPEITSDNKVLKSADFDWEDSWNTCDRSVLEFPETEIPDEFSWSTCANPGIYVTIKNQAGCGSCWAFAKTAELEIGYRIENRGKKDRDFSEQQFMDCSWADGNLACWGGRPEAANNYIKNTDQALLNEGDYPYEEKNVFRCRYDEKKPDKIDKEKPTYGCVVNKIDEQYLYFLTPEEIKLFVINRGPLAVGVAADSPDSPWFVANGKRVLDHSIGCNEQLNHAVVIHGWEKCTNSEGEEGYCWRIQNSWGTDWGYDGYALLWISDFEKYPKGVCGVNMSVSYTNWKGKNGIKNYQKLCDGKEE